jgi:hypothetical protein
LWSDLLSSMPMCFNLLGELWDDPGCAAAALSTWWTDVPGTVRELRFEWSPGRLAPEYLGNKSAFDAAFLLDLSDGSQGVVGIECKYHEHAETPKKPLDRKKMRRYREVTERSGVFAAGWEAQVVGTAPSRCAPSRSSCPSPASFHPLWSAGSGLVISGSGPSRRRESVVSDFAHPGAEPAEFDPVVLRDAEGSYATLVVRNHRVVRVAGTGDRPVLVREFVDEEEFRALTDRVLQALGEVGGLSLCFVGDGFDPSSVHSPDDEVGLERSEAWAAVFFVPPGVLPALRQAVAGALAGHHMPTAWVIPSADDADIVVRAHPEPA